MLIIREDDMAQEQVEERNDISRKALALIDESSSWMLRSGKGVKFNVKPVSHFLDELVLSFVKYSDCFILTCMEDVRDSDMYRPVTITVKDTEKTIFVSKSISLTTGEIKDVFDDKNSEGEQNADTTHDNTIADSKGAVVRNLSTGEQCYEDSGYESLTQSQPFTFPPTATENNAAEQSQVDDFFSQTLVPPPSFPLSTTEDDTSEPPKSKKRRHSVRNKKNLKLNLNLVPNATQPLAEVCQQAVTTDNDILQAAMQLTDIVPK